MDELEIKIKYGDLEAVFKGPPSTVAKEVLKWVNEHIPGFIIASKLFHEPDYVELSDIISGYVKTTSEGRIYLTESARKFSMHIKILLVLSLIKILNYTGYREDDLATLEELASILISTQKSVSSRLSELKSYGYIEKLKEGKQTKYRITIRGLLYLVNKLG